MKYAECLWNICNAVYQYVRKYNDHSVLILMIKKSLYLRIWWYDEFERGRGDRTTAAVQQEDSDNPIRRLLVDAGTLERWKARKRRRSVLLSLLLLPCLVRLDMCTVLAELKSATPN